MRVLERGAHVITTPGRSQARFQRCRGSPGLSFFESTSQTSNPTRNHYANTLKSQRESNMHQIAITILCHIRPPFSDGEMALFRKIPLKLTILDNKDYPIHLLDNILGKCKGSEIESR